MIYDNKILHLQEEISRLKKNLELIDKIQTILKKPNTLKKPPQSNNFIA